MADYYPLIARAVAGLEKNTGENRRTLYDRARTALLTQLRGITPALPESDITRERLALEESIRKVEAESARQFVEASRQSRLRAAEPRREEAPPRQYVSPPAAVPPERPSPPRADSARTSPAPPAPPETRQSDLFVQRQSAQPSPLPPRAPPRWPPAPPAPGRPASDGVVTDFRGAAPERPDLRMFDQQAPQERMFAPTAPPASDRDFPQEMLEPSYDDAHPLAADAREMPPPPIEDEQEFEAAPQDLRPARSYRGLIRGLAAAAVVIAVGGGLYWQWPNLAVLYRSYRAAPVEVAREVPPPATAARPKITDRIEPGQQAPAAVTPGAQQASTVAQKVVLYEEDPGDPNGKRFVGSAIWRTETVTPGPGQTPELAVRADIEVPERKLAMTWSLRRNTDKGLPATHTVEIMFKLPADFPAGGISNVPGILMKQAEQTRGVPLAGLAVKVTSGFYLIGLSNLDSDKERNLQLLKERAWFDIPVVYNNNRRAILAMEKGTPGERAFADAFKAWRQ